MFTGRKLDLKDKKNRDGTRAHTHTHTLIHAHALLYTHEHAQGTSGEITKAAMKLQRLQRYYRYPADHMTSGLRFSNEKLASKYLRFTFLKFQT